MTKLSGVSRSLFLLFFSFSVFLKAGAQSASLFDTGIHAAGGPVAVADFDQDGNLDIATGSGVLLLGNGDGTFRVGTSLPPTSSLTAADFNNDGKPDLVFVNPPNISVLLGNGDGTFQSATNTDVGATVTYLAAADLGNGKVDLVMRNPSGDGIWVLIGKGDGTFELPVPYSTGAEASAVVIADLNHDGKLDVAVADHVSSGTGSVTVLLGNGDGSLQIPQAASATINPTALAFGDFNGDGKLDLAAAAVDSTDLNIFVGNGDGSFQAPQSVTLNIPPSNIIAANFGSALASDIAVFIGGTEIQILSNNGSGTFAGGNIFGVGAGAGGITAQNSLVIADFNHDQKPDLVAADVNTASVMLGKGSSTFQGMRIFAPPAPVATGDFNGDGKPDVVGIITAPVTALAIATGNGDGTFAALQTFPAPFSRAIATGDFNGDNKLDVAVGGNGTGVALLLGNGNGTFQEAQTISDTGGQFLTAVDLTGNHHLDLVSLTGSGGGSVVVELGNGDGTFQSPVSYPAGASSRSLVVADWNDDGKLDLILMNSSGMEVLLGNGDGTFAAAAAVAFSGVTPSIFAVGDFNRDGLLDVAIADASKGRVFILLGSGGGSFTAGLNYALTPTTLLVQDIDGDTNPDLVMISTRSVLVALGNGDGTFQTVSTFRTGGISVLSGLTFADFNRDSHLDAVASSADGFKVLLNHVTPGFTLGLASGQKNFQSIHKGDSATFNLLLTPFGPFSGTVSLKCSVSPVVSPAPACNLPSSADVALGSPTPLAVTLVTLPKGGAVVMWRGNQTPAVPPMALTMLLIAALPLLWTRRRRFTLALTWGVLALATLVGCGGGSSQSKHGTPGGTYTLTVTATAPGGLSSTQTLSVQVLQ